MKNEKTINLATSDKNTSTWYLDTEGDLHQTRDFEDGYTGVASIIIADAWYPGSIEDWKKTILSQL